MYRPVYDPTITYENHKERELLYLEDLSYDLNQDLNQLPFFLQYLLTHGVVLGRPAARWNSKHPIYGCYLPKRLNTLIVPDIPMHPELTPTSAERLGFVWKHDVKRYDPSLGMDKVDEWLSENWEVLVSGKYRLGVARVYDKRQQGLYWKVPQKSGA